MFKQFKQAAIATCITGALLAAPSAQVYAADGKAITELFNQVKLDYEVFTLPNGLTTMVLPNHKSPSVFVGMYYLVGSKDEPEGRSGFAHLYEHLMFKGTKNSPEGHPYYMNEIGATGLNGMTSTDDTQYFQTVPTGALDQALWLESDRMANITTGITQKKLDDERKIVKNEKRQGEARPGAKKWDLIRENLYPKGHPYAHSVIGSLADLNAASLEDVHQWHRDYNGANNTILVLAGDVTVAQAKKKVGKYFSDVHPGNPIAKVAEYIPTIERNRYVELYDNVPSTVVSRHWPIPNGSSKENVLLEHLSSTLAGHNDSRLTKLLVDDLKYVNNIMLNIEGQQVNGVANLTYEIRPEANVSKAVIDDVIDREMAAFFKQGPDMELLRRKTLIEDASLVRAAESADLMASFMIEGLMSNGDPEFFKTVRQWQTTATQADLKKVAEKWLSQPYLEVVMKPKPESRLMANKVNRNSMPDVQETIANIEFPELQETTLDNGIEIKLISNSDRPVVEASINFGTGSRANYQYTRSTAARVFGQLLNGSDNLSKKELEVAQENLALTMRAHSSETISGIDLNMLTPFIDDSFKLVAEVLKHPSFPEEEVNKELERIEAHFRGLKNNTDAAAEGAYNQLLWGKNHEFGKFFNKEEFIAAVSREQMVNFHQNELGTNNMTVWLYGDISLDKAKAMLNKHFGDWGSVTPTPLKAASEPEGTTGKVVLIDAPGLASTQITAAHLTAEYDPDSNPIERIVNGVLGGYNASRLNTNLREDKNWTYGISSRLSSNPYQRPGTFSIDTQVQADKTVASIKEIQKELDRFINKRPVSQMEVDKYRDLFIKGYPTNFVTDADYLSSAKSAILYDLPYDFDQDTIEIMQAITLEEVRAKAKEVIKPDELIWVITGDLSKFERELRKLNLGDVEVWDAYRNKVR